VQDIDTTKAHPARMYFLLGGKDHFEADRQAITGLGTKPGRDG
jgi:S-adenosyl methyltransferase